MRNDEPGFTENGSGERCGKSNTSVSADKRSSPKGQKEKAGFYLTKDLIDDLEFVWVQTRSITGNRISKSEIVGFALRNLIDEFRENPEEHKLVQECNN